MTRTAVCHDFQVMHSETWLEKAARLHSMLRCGDASGELADAVAPREHIKIALGLRREFSDELSEDAPRGLTPPADVRE